MKILALDFDGVIFETMPDNMLNAFNVYLKFFQTKIFQGKELAIKDYKTIKDKRITKIFRKYAISTRCAEELVLIFYAIDNNKNINNFTDTDKLRKKFPKQRLLEMRKAFYKSRYKLQKEKEWMNLNQPYPIIVNAIKNTKHPIHIITNKDKKTVKLILDSVKIKFKTILDKDISTDKSEKFINLIDKLKVIPENIYYIDDNIDHILKVKKLGVKCFLADWGYNTKKEIKMAKQKGVKVISQEQFKNVV